MPAMVPVYFQFSRWLYAYFKNPMFSIDYTYHDQTADTYIQDLLKSLSNPQAEPVAMRGVATDGLNVDYVKATDRNNQDLLERPCGDPGSDSSKAPYNNGTTTYTLWRSAFSALFANDEQLNTTGPVFAIIDTDSAHHLSAPLVERAVSRIGTNDKRAVAVVNFDLHLDYGTGSNGKIGCQGWGYYVCNKIADAHEPLAATYVQLGGLVPGRNETSPAINWKGAKWRPAGETKVTGLDGDTVTDQVGAALDQVKKSTKTDRVDAYVTVDLDLVQTSHTPYGDGKFLWADALTGVQQCLAAMKGRGSHLIGFDVCGLPAHPGDSASAYVKGTRPTKKEAIANANAQVKALWGEATGY